MPLSALNLLVDASAVPGDVHLFLREAERRIERFQRQSHIHGFVPSDFRRSYCVLRALAAHLARGSLLCEWGSGFGVIACLAAMLEFDVCGIEIESELVDAAQRLADDFGLPVQFVCGSFIPKGAERLVSGDFAWLSTDGNSGHGELELAPDDFDVVFSYPWPDEETLTEKLFERYAAFGAVLVTYHGGEDFRLRRKTGRAKRTERSKLLRLQE
jgi:hypothetical protein